MEAMHIIFNLALSGAPPHPPGLTLLPLPLPLHAGQAVFSHHGVLVAPRDHPAPLLPSARLQTVLPRLTLSSCSSLPSTNSTMRVYTRRQMPSTWAAAPPTTPQHNTWPGEGCLVQLHAFACLQRRLPGLAVHIS